jgi:hypothetical protein
MHKNAAYMQLDIIPASSSTNKPYIADVQWEDVRSESALDHLKHIGREIVRNCDGLPLAIKAIGGLLRTKGATEHEWRGVLHDPAWKMDKHMTI